MKPIWYDYSEYLYFFGDEFNCIYFLQEGVAEFVHPRYNNKAYLQIENGN